MNQNNEALVQSLCAIAECHSPISETREQLENSIRYALSHRPEGEAVDAGKLWAFLHDSVHEAHNKLEQCLGREEYHAKLDGLSSTLCDEVLRRFLNSCPPGTVPRSELEAANRLASSLLEIIGRISDALGISEEDQSVASGDEEILFAIAELQAKAVPEGMALVSVAASPAVLDRAVSFALNVSLSSKYTWSDYMRDLWAQMIADHIPGATKMVVSQADPAPAASPVVPEACEWREDTDGVWQSDCGVYYSINDDTPEKNGMKFCLGCGKPLRTILPASDISGSECGNCFEGKSDLDHECQKCGGTGEVK